MANGMSAHGTDPEVIELAPLAAERELVAELHAANARKLALQAFQPGKYEVEFGDGHAPAIQRGRNPPGPGSHRALVCALRTRSGAGRRRPRSRSSSPGAAMLTRGSSITPARRFTAPLLSCLGTLLKGDRRLYLDLGRVEVMAEVKVNGKRFPLLWKPPYRLDVTAAARAGRNTIEVAVVNLWPNRLIGDEQLPEDSERNPDGTLKRWPQWLLDGKPSPTGRYTFSMWRLWKKNDALLDSGLIGPVKLIPAQEFEIRR